MSGWGGHPRSETQVWRPERYNQLQLKGGGTIARGSGRSYGDAALNHRRNVVLFERLDRMLEFDAARGLLRAEAGVSLAAILDVFVAKGWFLPVTPGTKFTTLGGCLAADVHGQNHHRDGSFSAHVTECTVMIADGTVRRCSATNNSALFWATVGGMGLTGFITEVTLQLIPIETAYMQVSHFVAKNLDEALTLLASEAIDDHYSVAWIDCLSRGADFGRSIIMNGHHAPRSALPAQREPLALPPKRRYTLPFHLPPWVLNRWVMKGFNSVYYRMQARKRRPFLQDYDSYFYPLDAFNHWNRMYGKRGFVQYQCLLPNSESGKTAIHTLLETVTHSQRAAFLAVLKRLGRGNTAPLSFPGEGFTLALDIPIGEELFPLLETLDEQIVAAGGRCYLAKDGRMSSATFRAMYPRLNEWQQVKEEIDPNGRFQSDLSRRLKMEVAR